MKLDDSKKGRKWHQMESTSKKRKGITNIKQKGMIGGSGKCHFDPTSDEANKQKH
jgi:hypothetical protein